MTEVVRTLRRVTGRSSDVAERLAGLESAVEAARGRLDDDLVAQGKAIVDRAGTRLRLSGDHTIVALAGATGSGKSSLFNALTGLDLAAVGVRRPTTAWALACSWGTDGSDELLEWLGIPARHQIHRPDMLTASAADPEVLASPADREVSESPADREMSGLILLDLPDHDSIEVAHHLEVERLVKLADLLVWVLDPQKYADAALHDRFLRPMSSYADVMLVALNHVDELAPDRVEPCLTDLRRLLREDGLGGVPVIATSATRGDGMGDLRKAIAERVAEKRSARERVAADVEVTAGRLAEQTGSARPPDLGNASRGELLDACADAAGVPVVQRAIENAWVFRAQQATGWPVTKWIGRFRPDPLRRLHLARPSGSASSAGAADTEVRISRTSIPQPSSVQRARVESAVRNVADEVTTGMPQPWTAAVRAASTSRLGDFSDALDSAVATTDLGVSRRPRWWSVVRLLQWVLFLTAVVGGLWLAALAFFAYLRLPQPGTFDWHGFPVPTLLLLGGAVLGVLLAGVSRIAARVSARRRAVRAVERLRTAIASVGDEYVVAPMQREVDAYVRCRDGLAVALQR